MILIIDNYDSFVYTLARYVKRLGHEYVVARNDKISLEKIQKLKPKAIILSPGPCTPKEAGICIELIKELGLHIPILGVCLGHQAIAEAYGGLTIRASKPVHGKASMIDHNGSELFLNIPTPFEAGRYHSLIATIERTSGLTITALGPEDEIMAFQHTAHPVYGVQFHPESILTPHGPTIIENFIRCAKDWHTAQQ